MVEEDVASSSDSKGEEEDDEGKKRMELDKRGILKLGGPNDNLDSLNGLFHWKMEDYELFPSCHMLGVEDVNNKDGKNEFST